MLKRLGWIVDAQNDFMLPSGKLYVRDPKNPDDLGAYAKILEFVRGLQYLRLSTEGLIYTQDWHRPNDPEISDTPDFVTTFPPHCLAFSYGAGIVAELKVAEELGTAVLYPDSDRVDEFAVDFLDARVGHIKKTRFDVFEGNPLVDKALAEIVEPGAEIVIMGVASDVCVDQAVRGFLKRGYDVTVLRNSIYGLGIKSLDDLKAEWFSVARENHSNIHLLGVYPAALDRVTVSAAQ